MSSLITSNGTKCSASLMLQFTKLSSSYICRLSPNGAAIRQRTTRPPNFQIRQKSSRRRMIKGLRLPPAGSFARSSSPYDHIIFNPPSSAPNVYHTPAKFLPASDSRRKLYSIASMSSTDSWGSNPVARPSGRSNTASIASEASFDADAKEEGQGMEEGGLQLPPSVRQIRHKKYHLTEADVDEMRRLRESNPRKYTRAALAEQFGCSEFFVSTVAKSVRAGQATQMELEKIKRTWGPRKIKARNDRVRRRESWGREL